MTVDNAAPSPFTETTGTARHAALAALTDSGPVQRLTLFTGQPVWLVTGYAEAREVFAHPAMARSRQAVPHRDVLPADLSAAMYTNLLTSNPPEHTRLRKLVTAAFTVRRIETLRPGIQEITDGLLDDLERTGADGSPVDLVAAFGYPLPITVIAELLGVPVDDRDAFRGWSSVIVNASMRPADTYLRAAEDMVAYVRGLISDKRRTPADDLLSALIQVHDGGDRLSEDELSSMVFLLLVAGHETTVNLISGAAYALLSRPEQMRLVRAEPDRLPAVIEEQLRHDGPKQVPVPSVATAPITVGGVTIPAGDVVMPALLAVNRDPARFAEPDRFDATRAAAPHLAFGHGLHHCLGAPLARLEGVIAVGSLVRRFPELRLADPDTEPERLLSLLLNGIASLPVTVS
ncbi:cytochrome P450 [Streptomyces sp. WMMC500]|uniref:cytochrome P450 family protein n=1 Tax=Streptomyces sp. WMMC500 TaxID=3015154 RepID=UPI00248C1B07|nr:cytochrome P450 [Streptomyces sp. WMMC500]WBB58487.1 cytochrome P450 [Streptomyces sp. WMMC500]